MTKVKSIEIIPIYVPYVYETLEENILNNGYKIVALVDVYGKRTAFEMAFKDNKMVDFFKLMKIRLNKKEGKMTRDKLADKVIEALKEGDGKKAIEIVEQKIKDEKEARGESF